MYISFIHFGKNDGGTIAPPKKEKNKTAKNKINPPETFPFEIKNTMFEITETEKTAKISGIILIYTLNPIKEIIKIKNNVIKANNINKTMFCVKAITENPHLEHI